MFQTVWRWNWSLKSKIRLCNAYPPTFAAWCFPNKSRLRGKQLNSLMPLESDSGWLKQTWPRREDSNVVHTRSTCGTLRFMIIIKRPLGLLKTRTCPLKSLPLWRNLKVYCIHVANELMEIGFTKHKKTLALWSWQVMRQFGVKLNLAQKPFSSLHTPNN